MVTPVAPAAVGFGHLVGRAWVAGHFELRGKQMRFVVCDDLLDLSDATSRITVLAFVVHATETLKQLH